MNSIAFRFSALFIFCIILLNHPLAFSNSEELHSKKVEDYDTTALQNQYQTLTQQLQATSDPQAKQQIATHLEQVKTSLNTITQNLNKAKSWAVGHGKMLGKIHGRSAGASKASDDANLQAKVEGETLAQEEANQKLRFQVRLLSLKKGWIDGLQKAVTETNKKYQSSIKISSTPLKLIDAFSNPDDFKKSKPILDDLTLAHSKEIIQTRKESLYLQIKAKAYEDGRLQAEKEAEAAYKNLAKNKIAEEFYSSKYLEQKTIKSRSAIKSRLFQSPSSPANFDFFTSPNYHGNDQRNDQPLLAHPEIAYAFKKSYDEIFLSEAATTYAKEKAGILETLKTSYKKYALEALMQRTQSKTTSLDDSLYQQAIKEAESSYTELLQQTISSLNSSAETNIQKSAKEAGYNENYSTFLEKHLARAMQEEKTMLQSQFRYEATGFTVLDGNEDTIFAPGEAAFLTLSLSNFSYFDKKNDPNDPSSFTVQIKSLTNGIQVDQSSDVLPTIPARSRSTITHIAPFYIKKDTRIGSKEKILATLLMNGKEIIKQEFQMEISYPYQIELANMPKLMVVRDDIQINITVKNISTKLGASSHLISMSTDPKARYVIKNNDQPVQTAPGQSSTITFTVSVDPKFSYDDFALEINIHENDWTLGRETIQASSSHRFEAHPSGQSAGLLIVDNNKSGSLAKAIQSTSPIKLDLVDVRTQSDVLSIILKYLDRFIVLIQDQPEEVKFYGRLQDLPADDSYLGVYQIKNYFNQGGQILHLSSVDYKNRFFNSEMGNLAQTKTFFKEAPLYQQFMFEPLAGGPKKDARPIRPGRFVSMYGSDFTMDILQTFDLMAQNFDEKINRYLRALAAKNTAEMKRAREIIIHELTYEMKDDERLDLDLYDNHKDILRLTQFVNIALSKSGVEQKAMASFYPMIDSARKILTEKNAVKVFFTYFWSRERAILKVAEPLEDLYLKFSKDPNYSIKNY